MPIVNGLYVSPDWKDDQAPALDAEELSAMSNTLEKLDNPLPALHVEVGTYVGTGTSGPNRKTSLTFNKKPKKLCVYSLNSSFNSIPDLIQFYINGQTVAGVSPNCVDTTISYKLIYAFLSDDGLTVSWYYERESASSGDLSYNATHQLNAAGITYGYTAEF